MKYGLEEAKTELLRLLDEQTSSGSVPASFPVVLRVKVPLVDIDPLGWLAGQKNARKVFWHSSETGLTVAGIGRAFEAAPEGWYGFNEAWGHVSECMDACPEARFFTGMSFARTVTGEEWKGFPGLRWLLPAVEVVKDTEGCWLAAHTVRGRDGEPFSQDAREALERMIVLEQVMPGEVLPLSREDVPDYEDWVCSAEAALESLEKEGLEKVVLARRVSFELKGELTPELLLRELMGRPRADFAFLFSVEGASFLGTTAHPLYIRKGAKVETRAVAGGESKEHRLVAGALVEVFREFCRSYQVDCAKEELRKTRQEALLMEVSGVLSEGVTDREFLQALHPAPVVCGVPAEKARLLLQQYEVFDRGWFGAPVGFFSRGKTELAVAASGCLTGAGSLHVYAGAPFVKGADPLAQWEEAGAEMKNILDLVHGTRGELC